MLLQRKSPKLFDAITADQFSKIGANDAAGALKKVTGVTITGGKYVYVRGLGDRYSKSTLNGSEIPNLDPDKNAIQLDLFPTSLIDNIMVYKTFTPDLPGDFTGGLVDISTKDFPNSFSFELSVGLGYNDQANFNNNFLTAKGSPTDFLGYDNGFRSLPSVLNRYTANNFPQPYIASQSVITQVSRAFGNTQFEPGHESQFLNHDISLSIGNQFHLFKKPLGFILGLSYSRDFSNYDNGIENVYTSSSQGQTSLDGDVLTATKEQKSSDEVLIGGMLNTSYRFSNNHKIGVSLLTNQSGSSEARYQDGLELDFDPDSSTYLQNRVISYMQRSFKNVQVRGEHVIPALHNLNIKWSNSYTVSSINQPDLRRIRTNYYPQSDGTVGYHKGNQDRPQRIFYNLDETTNNARLDFTLPLSIVKNWGESRIKFGGAYTYKDRSFRESLYEYYIDNPDYDGNIDAFFQEENLGFVNNELKNYLIIQNEPDNSYDAHQKLLASYLMVETPLWQNLKVTTGIRFEKTDMNVKSLKPTAGDIQTSDFLPSLAVTYSINELTNLRLSANRTIARPSFREFAPLAMYEFLGGYLQDGNPGLKRTLISNFDLRWEKFPSQNEYLSFSLFYKRFFNPIENTQLPSAGGSASEFQYNNIGESNLYGIELEARKNLGIDGSLLQHFRISANFTYVYSFINITDAELQAIRVLDPGAKDTRPMFNQAPYTINGSLTYENPEKGWESTLSYNVTGKRLIVYQTDLPSIYLQPMPELDFTLKKEIFRDLSVRFRAKNLLNSAYNEQMTLGGNAFYSTKYQMGRTFSLSLSYKFN